MKLFVGIPCPEELVPSALRVQEALDAVPGRRPYLPEDLHLTVIPPWEERDPDAVARDLAAIDAAPFPLVLEGAGYGPSKGPPSLAWLLAAPSPELDRLWLQTWRALWSQDPPRSVFPHITVTRFPEDSSLPALPELAPAVGILDRVSLYESLGGGRYKILATRLLGQ